MSRPRDTFRYELRDHHKLVYVGITGDPTTRSQEHVSDGKRFTSMNVVGPSVTRPSAETWEEERLATYRDNHCGRNPRYNKTNT